MDILFKFKVAMSGVAIVYIWMLPLLSKIGFSEDHSTSVSEYIANPPATGAMAAVSFIPLTLVWEYQDIILENINLRNDGNIVQVCSTLYYSTAIYQLSYGTFLICTQGYVKNWVHTITVVCFSGSFILHTSLTFFYTIPSKITSGILGIGSTSCAVLLIMMFFNVSNLWFWFFECIALTCMYSFTPTEWIMIYKQNYLKHTHEGCFADNHRTIFNDNTEMMEMNNSLIDSFREETERDEV
jgi:hypothetical protein